MPITVTTMTIFEPLPGVFAYYDGRVPGRRLHSPNPNWLDDGAFELGTASYAIVEGRDALVYDTHMSLCHAEAVRAHLEGLGVGVIRVALSHWHRDHVAGNAAFCDCEIVALTATAAALRANREAIVAGNPPIVPLIMPTRLFDNRLELTVGARRVELHHFDIHSHDGAVLWLPDERVLLPGDTLEDPITYVAEPARLATHIAELDRLRAWPIARILPNHGDPARLEAGGFDARLIDANRRYLERLSDPAWRAKGAPLADWIAEDVAAGAVVPFDAYDAVHRRNVAAVEDPAASRAA